MNTSATNRTVNRGTPTPWILKPKTKTEMFIEALICAGASGITLTQLVAQMDNGRPNSCIARLKKRGIWFRTQPNYAFHSQSDAELALLVLNKMRQRRGSSPYPEEYIEGWINE